MKPSWGPIGHRYAKWQRLPPKGAQTMRGDRHGRPPRSFLTPFGHNSESLVPSIASKSYKNTKQYCPSNIASFLFWGMGLLLECLSAHAKSECHPSVTMGRTRVLKETSRKEFYGATILCFAVGRGAFAVIGGALQGLKHAIPPQSHFNHDHLQTHLLSLFTTGQHCIKQCSTET